MSAVALTLGADVKRGRRRRRSSQAALADAVDVDQTRISQIERGLGRNVPLETWIAIGIALGQPLAVAFSKTVDPSASVADAGHLQIQESLLEHALRLGRRAAPELPTRPLDPRHSTDVAIRDDPHRVLVLAEAWNTFADIGASIRSTHRKAAEAADLAVVIGAESEPYRVATVWVVRDSAANRALVERYPSMLATSFDGSSHAWARALTTVEPPPSRPGLVWFDAATGHIRAWRRGRSARR